jgi:2-hydroxycyclohexanecarboxyl-CoA dehydrogenase
MTVLNGKVAIVTGAGSGIGRGEAIALAKEGAAIVLVGRTLERLEAVSQEIKLFGGTSLPVVCDVRLKQQVDDVIDQAVNAFGTIDILVNNAQIMPKQQPIEDWTEQQMRETWESGLMGSWLFMVGCLPYMKKRGGRIINTCSPTGHGIGFGWVGYSTTKEGIRSLTRCAAREWGQYNINVNAISPVSLSPEQAAAYGVETADRQQEVFDAMGSIIRRYGDAEKDIGRSVVFLAGPDSAMITGCTLSVDGGCAML